jgi:hypothetical protein
MKRLFIESFAEFLVSERANILNGTNERNLCGRLALYLERQKDRDGLRDYYADTEYNRKQHGKVKTIIDGQGHVIKINCDLILHSRGEIPKRDNLIAIEMKKAGRPESETGQDHLRLKAMTKASYDDVWSADGETLPEHVCGYEFGVFVLLDSTKRTYRLDYFQCGRSIGSEEGEF